MKAVLINTIGEPKVLDIQNIPKPKITNAYEVLVRIKAASVNPIDIKLRAGDYPLTNFPAILGCDAAGIVDEIKNTTSLAENLGNSALTGRC